MMVSGLRQLGLAGFFATAVAFGPARNGYGLFLPDIREEFGLSTVMLGLIASGLYAGYLAALFAVGLFAARVGPRLPVMIGLLSAGVGMALVALSSNATMLAAGVILAGTSAGWSWSPYNDAVEQVVSPHSRNRALSIISTGSGGRGAMRRLGWNWLVRAGSAPLFVVALSFGVVNAIYLSFAVDLLTRSGEFYELSRAAGPVFYAVLGVVGFAGLFTGDAVARFGLRRVLVAIQASLGISVGLLGLAPASLLAVGVSAVLFGIGVMTMSALLSVWSSAVFPEQPSTGFSATFFLFAVGNVTGPAAAGAFAGKFGLDTAFLITGVLALLTALVRPTGELLSTVAK